MYKSFRASLHFYSANIGQSRYRPAWEWRTPHRRRKPLHTEIRHSVTDISAVIKRLVAESLWLKIKKAKKSTFSKSDSKKSDFGKFVAEKPDGEIFYLKNSLAKKV